MRSREKGKRGEREFAQFLTLNDHPAKRGCQYKGGDNSPDVICESLSQFHFEVKRTEAFRLYDALSQAELDAGVFKIPIVAHRRNDKPWVCVLRTGDFLSLVDKALKFDALVNSKII